MPKRFLAFVVGVALALGVVAFFRAPQSVFPAISLARVEVFVDAGDLMPEDLRASVADPLEAAFAPIPGIAATRSYVDQGKLEIELDFDPHGDVREDLHEVEATLAQVRDRLPIDHATALIEGPNMEPVVTYAIRSDATTQSELRKMVEDATLGAFTGTPGLARVTVFGGPRIGFDVNLDAKALRASGTTASDVAQAIGDAARLRPAATIERGEERILVVPPRPPRDFDSLRAVPIADRRHARTVPLSSLATIRVADESTNEQASFDAKHAVVINAYPDPSADAVSLKREVESRLPALRAKLPPDADIALAWDQTRLITASQNGLRDEMLLGAAIALAIIFLFLRNRALTLVAAFVLPAAIALTVLVLVSSGLTLNLMTLGGLAIAVGLIIDEAIVVVEAVAREIAGMPDGDVRVAIARAVRRIARPLATATAANVVVFLPLGFLSGIPGAFFRALSITLAISLLVSIALSLFAAPALAAGLLQKSAAPLRTHSSLERAYVRVLRWCERRTAVVYAAALAVFVVTIVMIVRLPTDFLPAVDEGEFEIKYALPAGMSIDAADVLAKKMEVAVLADPAVAHEARLSGVDTNGYLSTPPDAGTIRVILKPGAPHFDVIADRLRIDIANINEYIAVEVHQLLEDQINDLSGAPEPLQLTVRGPRQSVLTKLAGKVADHIDDVHGVVDVFDGVIYEARTIDAMPAGPGPSGDAFAGELRARANGIVAARLPIASVPVPVVVRLRDDPTLTHIARLQPPQLVTQVQEENGARIVRVTAGIENADLSTVIASVRHALFYTLKTLPKGYSVEIGGAIQSQRAAFAEFALVLGIAVLLVFAVLVLGFDSFRLPLVILAAIPLSPIGVAGALYLTRTPINVSSIMGMLLLIGIVVRNGILLVDAANRHRRAGEGVSGALEHAASERLRPILMTTLAALGALLPLAIGIGSGSEMARPLAIAVAGGLVTSTAFTLIFIPILYSSVVQRNKTRQIASIDTTISKP